MSLMEIINELPKLKPEERSLLAEKIDLMEANEVEISSEMDAAIQEGIKSMQNQSLLSFEEVQKMIPLWASTK